MNRSGSDLRIGGGMHKGSNTSVREGVKAEDIGTNEFID